MKKIESEYNEKYGDVPRGTIERLDYLLKNIKLSDKNRSLIFKKMRDVLDIKWNRVNFTIYLLPKATPRPRHNTRFNIYYVLGAKDNKDIFMKFMKNCDVNMITTPCKFTCISYLPIPSTMNPVEKILAELGLVRPITKPDWDNLGKTYSDMIQDSLIFDDYLIIEGTSKKYYSVKPRIEISIEYMDKYDSDFNENKIRKKVNK